MAETLDILGGILQGLNPPIQEAIKTRAAQVQEEQKRQQAFLDSIYKMIIGKQISPSAPKKQVFKTEEEAKEIFKERPFRITPVEGGFTATEATPNIFEQFLGGGGGLVPAPAQLAPSKTEATPISPSKYKKGAIYQDIQGNRMRWNGTAWEKP